MITREHLQRDVIVRATVVRSAVARPGILDDHGLAVDQVWVLDENIILVKLHYGFRLGVWHRTRDRHGVTFRHLDKNVAPVGEPLYRRKP